MTLCKRAGCVKPDAPENVHMTFVQIVVGMVELIPELCDSDEIDNVDRVDTRNYCEVIYFSTLPFTLEPGIKIALLGTDSPFSWQEVFCCVYVWWWWWWWWWWGGAAGCEGFVT